MMGPGLSARSLLSIDQLDREAIDLLLQKARTFSQTSNIDLYKKCLWPDALVANLFFENSTRTLMSFEVAAKRLSAQVINVDTKSSSMAKGETLLDMLSNIEALGCDIAVIRHPQSGIFCELAEQTEMTIVNAGDGKNEHPTQALLDVFTLCEHYNDFSKKALLGVKVSIIGDIKHSRVASSNIKLLHKLGAKVTVFGHPSLMPEQTSNQLFAKAENMDEAVSQADVVMMLRIQKERFAKTDSVVDGEEYFANYGLSIAKTSLLKKDTIILHPGPVNHGVEIESKVLKSPRSLVLRQAKNGVFIRMAVLDEILKKRKLR